MADQNQLAQQQQARQAALTTLLIASLTKLWPLIDLANLSASLPKYQAAVAALVYKYGQASATLSARYYQTSRSDAGVTGRFVPVPADPAGITQVQKSIGWATKGLWSPDAKAKIEHLVGAALEEPDAVKNAKVLTNGAAQKMVVDAGRNTLIEAIQADQKCRGWAREAKPTACAFCAMLSTRGAVYRTEKTADFQAHSHCHCMPVPLFADHYEPPAYIRHWKALYYSTPRGSSAAETRKNFRDALEASRNPTPQPVGV